MRTNKVRAVPLAHQLCSNFNAASSPTNIPDHNDMNRIDWMEVKNEKQIVGSKALTIPHLYLSPPPPLPTIYSYYRLFYPFLCNTFNDVDYSCVQAVLADIERIWTDSLVHELEIPRSAFPSHAIVLVIPDRFSRVRFLILQVLSLFAQSSLDSFRAHLYLAPTTAQPTSQIPQHITPEN